MVKNLIIVFSSFTISSSSLISYDLDTLSPSLDELPPSLWEPLLAEDAEAAEFAVIPIDAKSGLYVELLDLLKLSVFTLPWALELCLEFESAFATPLMF